jgi:hypothetical protein
MRLPQRCKNYPLVHVVSFFNELEIKKPCSSLVSFFNELEIRKSMLKTSVSFFNEVASEMQKLSSETSVSFFKRLPQRCKNYPQRPLFLIMDSKRTMLRKETMSREKTRSWLPRGLHWKEEIHSGRTPC